MIGKRGVNISCKVKSERFKELNLLLLDQLKEKGYECTSTDAINLNMLNIIIGASDDVSYYLKENLPSDTIIVNLEEFYHDCKWSNSDYIKLLKIYKVWDYSSYNVNYLEKYHGIKAELLKISYCKSWDKITRKSENEKDIDVLFLGDLSLEHTLIKNEIEKHAEIKKSVFMSEIWGKERDDLISRSKIILNIHGCHIGIFESLKIMYLISNESFVITEKSLDDLDYKYLEGLVRVDFSELTNTVIKYLKNVDERNDLRVNMYEKIQKMGSKMPDLSINSELLKHDLSTFYDEKGKIIRHKDLEREEQLDAYKFIPSDSVVLELGSRYGLVSSIIRRILSNAGNHVAVEPDKNVIEVFKKNMSESGTDVKIFNGTISKNPVCITYNGYSSHTNNKKGDDNVKICSLLELEKSYGLKFDVLVADCEGFIGQFVEENDMSQFKVIILEKDQCHMCDYDKVENSLSSVGFLRISNHFKEVYRCVYINMNNLPFKILNYKVGHGCLGLFGKLGYLSKYGGNDESEVIYKTKNVGSLSVHAPSQVCVNFEKDMMISGYCSPTGVLCPKMVFKCDSVIIGEVTESGSQTNWVKITAGEHLLDVSASNLGWAHSVWLYK